VCVPSVMAAPFVGVVKRIRRVETSPLHPECHAHRHVTGASGAAGMASAGGSGGEPRGGADLAGACDILSGRACRPRGRRGGGLAPAWGCESPPAQEYPTGAQEGGG